MAPLDSAGAASSLRGGDSTAEGPWVSGRLEEQIYQSKVKEERLEAFLQKAKAKIVRLEAEAAKFAEIGEVLQFAIMLGGR